MFLGYIWRTRSNFILSHLLFIINLKTYSASTGANILTSLLQSIFHMTHHYANSSWSMARYNIYDKCKNRLRSKAHRSKVEDLYRPRDSSSGKQFIIAIKFYTVLTSHILLKLDKSIVIKGKLHAHVGKTSDRQKL